MVLTFLTFELENRRGSEVEGLDPVSVSYALALTIADGHYRICASRNWDEECPVACCLVALHSLSAGSRTGRRRSHPSLWQPKLFAYPVVPMAHSAAGFR